jgi:hypothetical protein
LWLVGRDARVLGGVSMDIKLFIWTWHWKDDDVMWVTCGVAVLMLALGIVFMMAGRGQSRSNWFSLGASLVSGGFVTVAIFGLQLASNLNAKEESFQLAIAMQSDLSGFSPRDHSLENAYLNSKILDGAQLSNANLRSARMRHAALRGTLLHKADLRQADLLGADLFEAELPHADLRDADLRSAKLEDADIWTADFRGALVNAETCWPPSFWTSKIDSAGLKPRKSRTPTREVPASRGHPCTAGEHAGAGPDSSTQAAVNAAATG